MSVESLGYYAIPAFVSFEGIDKQVNTGIGKALGRFGDIGKTTGAALAQGIGDGAAQGKAQIDALTKSYEKFRDRAEDALGKIRVEEEKLKRARAGGKADQIAAAEERLAKARRDSTRASKESAAAQDAMHSAQRRMGESADGLIGKLKNLGGAAGSAGTSAATGFVEGFGGPIARLGTAGGPIGLALAATAALGLSAGAVLAKNVMSAIEREPARDLLQAQLGLDDASMAKLGQTAAKAYKDNFGESVNANISAAGAALRSGLISSAGDPGAQKVIEQLDSVSKLLGEEVPAVARSAAQLIRTGMVKDAAGAFDLIVKGEQAGLNEAQDWLDTLNEYPTEFRKLGLTGAEAAGLISQAMKGGARDSDVAADAIKEFSIRAVDGSKNTMAAFEVLGFDAQALAQKFAAGGPAAKEAFGQVLSAIRSVQDPLKQSQIAVALFGTQAEDLGGAFNNFDVSRAVQQLGMVDGAAQRAADTMGNNTAGKFEQARRTIETSLEAVQDKLKEGVTPALDEFATWIKTHEPEITSAFVKIGEFAVDMAQDVISTSGDIAIAAADLIAPIGDVLGALTKVDAWQREHIDGDKAAADKLRAEAEGYFGWGESLKSAGEKMKEFATTKGDALKRSMREIADGMKDGSKEAGGFGKAGDVAGDKMKGLAEQVDTATGKVNDLRDAMNKPLIGPGINLNLPGTVDPSAPAIGPGLNGPSAPMAAPSSLGSKDEIAKYILATAQKYGYSPDQQVALLSAALQESGLDPNAKGGGGAWHGIYQQDASYPGRDNPQTNIDEFFKRLQGKGGPNGDIWKNIFWLQQRPAATSADAALAGGRQAYLDEIKSQMGPAADLYRRLTGTGAAAAPAAPAPSRMPMLASNVGQVPYGLPVGSDSGGYGGKGVEFPAWVYQLGAAFNLKPSSYAGHQEGSGLNQGIDWTGAVEDMQRFAEWLTTNKPNGLQQVIWQNPNTMQMLGLTPGGEVVTQGGGYYRDDWKDHRNHVHTSQNASIPLPGGQMSALGSMPTAAGLGLTSAGSADLVNAFGRGYKPGIGTPGYDEEGNPGYYRVDPRDLAQAQRQVEDTQQAIVDADQRILDAKQARADLETKALTTAADRAKADEEIAKAERAAGRARQDAAFAQEDAAKTAQGKFTAAKKAEKSKNGDSQFGELGSIGAAFLKDMFGLGDIFPDPSQLGIVKMAQAVLGLKYTPQGTDGQAAGQQKQSLLGMLTPGGADEANPGGGASGLLGILPGVSSLFQPPDDTQHMPGGPPGPVGPQMVDQSTHLTLNNPQGTPESNAAMTRRTLLQTPRLGTYQANPGVMGN